MPICYKQGGEKRAKNMNVIINTKIMKFEQNVGYVLRLYSIPRKMCTGLSQSQASPTFYHVDSISAI